MWPLRGSSITSSLYVFGPVRVGRVYILAHAVAPRIAEESGDNVLVGSDGRRLNSDRSWIVMGSHYPIAFR